MGDDYLTTSKLSYYTNLLGVMTDSDQETYASYWQTALQRYTETTEESGLPAWAWALIGVAIGAVVIGAGLAVFFIVRAKNKKSNAPKEERIAVDTTDDTNVDVYTQAETVKETLTPAEQEEATDAPAEDAEKYVAETPAEEPAAPAEASAETPAAPAEASAETPAEAPAPAENGQGNEQE